MLINAVSAKSGGAAIYCQNLACELAKTNQAKEYVFVVPAWQRQTACLSANHIRVLTSDVGQQSSWKRFLWDQIELRRIVEREGVDVLLSSSDFGLLFPPCPQILMVRNSLFFSQLYFEKFLPLKSRRFRAEFLLRRRLIALSVRYSDVVVAPSQSMLNDLRRFISIPDGKAVVNPFGVPLGLFPPQPFPREKRPGDAGKQFQILFVSEYSDYKNLTTLLRAVRLMREQGANGFCVVTTADPTQFPGVEISTREDDKALAVHPLVAPVVKFTGPVPYDGIQSLYQESDLFVFPSFAESFGHPLVEAMATGLPIIASDIPVCREICDEAAVYFRASDPEDLARKIILLRVDSQLRQQLGQAGRHRARTHFDWKEHVRRLSAIIERAAGRA